MSAHAPLAPSSAPVWGHCPGSVVANLQAPDVFSERAREGEASHWVGAECLNKPNSACIAWLGKTAPNGVVIDEEMAEGAQAWVNDVLSTSAKHGAPHGLLVEHRVTMPNIHPDNWGTLDSAIWLPECNTLYIWDYKYGHREVDVFENLQLIDYVAGLIGELGLTGETRVIMRVVQPFCYHAVGTVREWSVTVLDLIPYLNQLTEAANQARTTPTMTAGRHCRDCYAVARCATARRATYSVITYAGEPYDINTLDGPDLAIERRVLANGLLIVKARLEALEDTLHAQIAKGNHTSGLTLQTTTGRLKWTVPAEQAIALALQFGIDISKPTAMTPTQAVNRVNSDMRPIFKTTIENATTRPSTGMKLIPIENSRSAYAFKPDRS